VDDVAWPQAAMHVDQSLRVGGIDVVDASDVVGGTQTRDVFG
jgi:hypothetical protein